MILPFDQVLKDCTRLGKKIPVKDYLEKGEYPIIDQGRKDIAGYRDDRNGLFFDVPAIIFGDHTRAVKYIEAPCFLGADGVKLLCPVNRTANCKYLYYRLQHARIPNTGYNRDFKFVKALDFTIPEIHEQNEVVDRLNLLDRAIKIPLPPLEIQNQFAVFVAQIDKSKLAVTKCLKKAEYLKSALMQQYFG